MKGYGLTPLPISPSAARAVRRPRTQRLAAVNSSPSRDDLVGQPELPVELERPRVHAQRARRRPGLRGLVDDAHAHAEPAEPEGEHQARRARAGDEDLGIRHGQSSRTGARRRPSPALDAGVPLGVTAPMPATAYPERACVLQRLLLRRPFLSGNMTTCEVTARGAEFAPAFATVGFDGKRRGV